MTDETYLAFLAEQVEDHLELTPSSFIGIFTTPRNLTLGGKTITPTSFSM